MKISVCMGMYNGKKYIGKQLECIRKQTRKPDEVILCDDGSTDGTADYVSRYMARHPDTAGWRLIRNGETKGYPGNYYYAMGLCSGDIVFLADQDDVWDIRKIGRMCQVMEGDARMKVLGCTFGLIDGDGAPIHTPMAPTLQRDSGRVRQISAAQVFHKCEWPGMVLCYRNRWCQKRVLCDAGRVPAGGGIPHDFLLCARAAEEHGFFQLEERLCSHRRHDQNEGGEEHRVSRLLRKDRKLAEIEDYNRILEQFRDGKVMRTKEGRLALERKLAFMYGRYAALASGRMAEVARNAWRHRGEARLAALVCDMAVVWQR